jgi:hypothetical protein
MADPIAAWLREMPFMLFTDLNGTMNGIPNDRDVTVNEFLRLLAIEAINRAEKGLGG